MIFFGYRHDYGNLLKSQFECLPGKSTVLLVKIMFSFDGLTHFYNNVVSA